MATSHLLNADFLAVMLVLAIYHLILLVDFVDIELVVKHEGWSLAGHEERVVLLEVGAINTVALPYFATD